jgi:hypothetical protein
MVGGDQDLFTHQNNSRFTEAAVTAESRRRRDARRNTGTSKTNAELKTNAQLKTNAEGPEEDGNIDTNAEEPEDDRNNRTNAEDPEDPKDCSTSDGMNHGRGNGRAKDPENEERQSMKQERLEREPRKK